MSSTDAVLSFRNIDFSYRPEQPILRDVSFDVPRQDVVTLLGPSGCGKSTLMNMAAGLLRPTSGECIFQNEPVDKINTKISYMTQDDTLLPWRTVTANVGLALKLQRDSTLQPAERQARIDHYLDLLNLSHSARKFPAQLSGGMKRRALLARSVITQPEVLLMDEPFGGIDASLRDDLHVELRRIVEVEKSTVMFVTHDIGEAALLSDRVLVFGHVNGATEITERIDIPLGRERDLKEIRLSKEYVDLQLHLREALEQRARRV